LLWLCGTTTVQQWCPTLPEWSVAVTTMR
jgi:hypothetical protein